ncbi:MAG TPA: flavodoxin family protein [Candidatus Methanoperedens sp.]
MKIIAIMGSPRGKGSGYRIVKMIEDRMTAMGDVEFEYLFLKDANLKPCIGCYNCIARGEDKCPLRDDRAAIEQKLLAADGFILSSPVHMHSISWLMKNFMDRFAYLSHRPLFHRQKMLIVVNTSITGEKGALSTLKISLGHDRGARTVHELAIATPPWPQTERAVAGKKQAIDVAAKKFYLSCLDTSLPLPTFNSYMDFLIMQKFSLICRQYLPADYAFYNGKVYFFDAKVNPIKAAAAKAIVGIYIYMMKDMGPGNVSWPATKKEEK